VEAKRLCPRAEAAEHAVEAINEIELAVPHEDYLQVNRHSETEMKRSRADIFDRQNFPHPVPPEGASAMTGKRQNSYNISG
jgi:hypothetical protein